MVEQPFGSSLTDWIYRNGEQVCGTGAGAVRINQMYIDDLQRYERLSGDSLVDFAAGVYVEEKDTGGSPVEPAKKRRGLIALVGSDTVIAYDRSWGRVRYAFYDTADFTAEPVGFKLKGKAELPGVRLSAPSEDVAFALSLWHVGTPDIDQMRQVCNQLVALVKEAARA